MVGANTDFLDRWDRWLNWWTLLCLPGFTLGVISRGLRGTLLICAAIVFLTSIILSGSRAPTDRPVGLAWKVRAIIRICACAATVLLTLGIVAEWVGPLWLALASLMAATSPPGIAAIWKRLPTLRTTSPPSPPEESFADPAPQRELAPASTMWTPF